MNRLVVVAVAIALLLGKVAGSRYLHDKPHQLLPVLEGLGGDFILPSTENRDIQIAEFRGKIVLLNFGFTSCPDVCPTVLSRMRVLLEFSGDDSANVQPMFVTIDPERDSIEKLKAFLPYFHGSIIGLRGDKQQLKEVASLYKAVYQKESPDSALEYSFMHNDHIYLIDQQGKVRAMYSSSAKVQTMAGDINTLL